MDEAWFARVAPMSVARGESYVQPVGGGAAVLGGALVGATDAPIILKSTSLELA